MGARALKVTAVVLNWKRPDDTIACVRSILETSPGTDVIVVDNASGDDSVARVRAAHPEVSIIENEANLGYAGGNNVGIRAALARDCDAVFVLNNDVDVQPGCLQTLTSFVASDEGMMPGLYAPVSVLPDGATVDFLVARVDLRSMALLADGRDAPLSEVDPDAVYVSDYATGSAFLASRRTFERIGVFDDRFFLVWEDVDLGQRALKRRGGGGVTVLPRAQVLHGRSVSFGGEGSPLYQYFYVRNSFLIVEKHAKRWRRARTRGLLERRYTGWLDKPETTPAVRRAIELGLEHGLAHRWGPTPAELARP